MLQPAELRDHHCALGEESEWFLRYREAHDVVEQSERDINETRSIAPVGRLQESYPETRFEEMTGQVLQADFCLGMTVAPCRVSIDRVRSDW